MRLAAVQADIVKLAAQHGIRTLAFPAISCGAYGYPLDEAVAIAVRECAQGFERHDTLEAITFACFDKRMLGLYAAALGKPG